MTDYKSYIKTYYKEIQTKMTEIYQREFELQQLIKELHAIISSPYITNCLINVQNSEVPNDMENN